MFIAKKVTGGEYLLLLSLSALSIYIRIFQNVSTRNINPVQALVVFEHFHLRHSYGKTICHPCRNSAIGHIDAAKVKAT